MTETLPYQPQSPTSRAAAATVCKSRTRELRGAIFQFIFRMGLDGATDDQLYHHFTSWPQPTVRVRRIELAREGLVVDSWRRRRTAAGHLAVVWTPGSVAPTTKPFSYCRRHHLAHAELTCPKCMESAGGSL